MPSTARASRGLALLALLLAGCVTSRSAVVTGATEADDAVAQGTPEDWLGWPLSPPPTPPAFEGPTPRLVTRAASLVGLSSLKPVAPHLPDDCTGLARAVYEDSGVELMGAGVPGDNGVTAIFRLALEKSALHRNAPAPGDLVFFEETYDRNRDGRRNDGLTHVGVVESVDPDGTVTFVHRAGGGVQRARLNVEAPLDGKRNDWLRPARHGVPGQRTGELFVTYASATRLLETLRAQR